MAASISVTMSVNFKVFLEEKTKKLVIIFPLLKNDVFVLVLPAWNLSASATGNEDFYVAPVFLSKLMTFSWSCFRATP